jgi:hypothetical protein
VNQRPAMSPEQQKYMAFEGLVAWTKAVIEQSRRTSEAQQRVLTRGEWPRPTPLRLDLHTFQCERHLFCIAAHKLLEYRQWVKDLAFLNHHFFSEIDCFARDIHVMRDMNEHAIEYFRGRGRRPKDWIHQGGYGTSDASSTGGTKIGDRLDWVELGSAAERLYAKIVLIGPFYLPP